MGDVITAPHLNSLRLGGARWTLRAKSDGIAGGSGRGSAGCSIVASALGTTDLTPESYIETSSSAWPCGGSDASTSIMPSSRWAAASSAGDGSTRLSDRDRGGPRGSKFPCRGRRVRRGTLHALARYSPVSCSERSLAGGSL
ncbi:hypothetical protein ACFXDI_49590 [Streptomyces mirabilis]|uniref:hypothetical protein n=1 Tax=Streptomyces mirabilis TaxID=68239 RepID=UPI00369FDF7E